MCIFVDIIKVYRANEWKWQTENQQKKTRFLFGIEPTELYKIQSKKETHKNYKKIIKKNKVEKNRGIKEK